ncbi:putative galacturonokinase [Helianthus anomalus]
MYSVLQFKLEPDLARRAEHYFSENTRAWSCGNFEEFGKLMSASGLSSIHNYECALGVYGARFSGAGFRGCCVAFVNSDYADKAASFVKNEYFKVQPELAEVSMRL